MSSWIVPMVLALTAAASTALAAQIDVKQPDRARVLKAADAYLKEEPITVTAASSPRSAGGNTTCCCSADSRTTSRSTWTPGRRWTRTR